MSGKKKCNCSEFVWDSRGRANEFCSKKCEFRVLREHNIHVLYDRLPWCDRCAKLKDAVCLDCVTALLEGGEEDGYFEEYPSFEEEDEQ